MISGHTVRSFRNSREEGRKSGHITVQLWYGEEAISRLDTRFPRYTNASSTITITTTTTIAVFLSTTLLIPFLRCASFLPSVYPRVYSRTDIFLPFSIFFLFTADACTCTYVRTDDRDRWKDRDTCGEIFNRKQAPSIHVCVYIAADRNNNNNDIMIVITIAEIALGALMAFINVTIMAISRLLHGYIRLHMGLPS